MRTVKTASGAVAVQIVYSNRRGVRSLEHIGSAHDEAGVELLKTVARQRLAAGQGELDLGLGPSAGGPLPILGSRMAVLVDALTHAYRVLGFDAAAGGDEVFAQLVLARIMEPTSKLDSARVLAEAGVPAASYPTLKRHLPRYADPAWRQRLSAACARHAGLGPSSLVLYDVSTLYFETDEGDGFREPGFSKERRLEPQITIGLLVDAAGFPLAVEAFEGNRAETTTMLPTIRVFMTAHRLTDVVIVADAGMVSSANQRAIEAEGLSFILGAKIPDIPYVVRAWHETNPGRDIPDGLVLTQPWPATPGDHRKDQVIHYQYRADRARRTLRGIDQQVAKAQRAVEGKAPVKRNRFITITGGAKSINRTLETKTRTLAGWKGYVTDVVDTDPAFVIGAYHQLWQVEKSFRMSKHDLQARPIFHHKRESIQAHLAVVFTALAVSRWIEAETGWSIKKFVRTTRRYREITIKAGEHTLTAADPLPEDLATAINTIHTHRPAH